MRSPASCISSISAAPMQFPANNNFLFKRASDEARLHPYEKMLGEGIRSFISELYMVDGGVLLGYICGHQHENLGDLIRCSTELVIKPGPPSLRP